MKLCQEENPVDVSILFLAPLFLSCQSSGAELCFTLFYFCVNPAEYIHVNIQTCVLSLSNQTFMMLSYAAKCSRMNFYSSIKQSVNRRWNFILKHLDVWTLLWGADSPYTLAPSGCTEACLAVGAAVLKGLRALVPITPGNNPSLDEACCGWTAAESENTRGCGTNHDKKTSTERHPI